MNCLANLHDCLFLVDNYPYFGLRSRLSVRILAYVCLEMRRDYERIRWLLKMALLLACIWLVNNMKYQTISRVKGL